MEFAPERVFERCKVDGRQNINPTIALKYLKFAIEVEVSIAEFLVHRNYITLPQAAIRFHETKNSHSIEFLLQFLNAGIPMGIGEGGETGNLSSTR
jgi:hypothetical protein